MASVGYADEKAFRFYHGDGDLVLRMEDAGWQVSGPLPLRS